MLEWAGVVLGVLPRDTHGGCLRVVWGLGAASARDEAGDGGAAVGLLGGEAVVGAAEDAAVGGVVGAAFSARDDVIVFEPGAAVAAGAVGALPGALQAVSLEHGAAGCAGDVSAGLRRRGDGGCAARGCGCGSTGCGRGGPGARAAAVLGSSRRGGVGGVGGFDSGGAECLRAKRRLWVCSSRRSRARSRRAGSSPLGMAWRRRSRARSSLRLSSALTVSWSS